MSNQVKNASKPQVNLNIINPVHESILESKSLFERAIIEAFKEVEETNMTNKLKIALDEMRFYVQDIIEMNSKGKTKSFLLNPNILDKLSRLIERKLFYVKIMVGRIYEAIIEEQNIPILTESTDILIKFSNEVLNLNDEIKTTYISSLLERKLIVLLNYIKSLKNIDYDQEIVIKDLVKNFSVLIQPKEISNDDLQKICLLCKSNDATKKMEGLNILLSYFSNTSSLTEQLHLMNAYVPTIVKALSVNAHSDFCDVYFQFGHILVSMFFNTSYFLNTNLNNYSLKSNLNENFLFFIYDNSIITNGALIERYNQVKVELSSQKKLLLGNDELFKIAFSFISIIYHFSDIFDMQFICFLILKRMYFQFSHMRKNIEDILINVLTNICLFKDEKYLEDAEECRIFISYIQLNDSTSLKEKLNERLVQKSIEIRQISNDGKFLIKRKLNIKD